MVQWFQQLFHNPHLLVVSPALTASLGTLAASLMSSALVPFPSSLSVSSSASLALDPDVVVSRSPNSVLGFRVRVDDNEDGKWLAIMDR